MTHYSIHVLQCVRVRFTDYRRSAPTPPAKRYMTHMSHTTVPAITADAAAELLQPLHSLHYTHEINSHHWHYRRITTAARIGTDGQATQ